MKLQQTDFSDKEAKLNDKLHKNILYHNENESQLKGQISTMQQQIGQLEKYLEELINSEQKLKQ